jgi:hypothetical protein
MGTVSVLVVDFCRLRLLWVTQRKNQMKQLMTLCVFALFGSSVSAQSYETAQDAFDARAWEAAAKLAR